MPTPTIPREAVEVAVRAFKAHLADGYRPPGQCGQGPGAIEAAAKSIGISAKALRNRIERGAEIFGITVDNVTADTPEEPRPQFTVSPLPDPDPPIDELLEHRCKTFERKSLALSARRLIPVKVNIPGPVGIVHFGDPHVDDDGCDIVSLRRDIKTVNSTDGMFGANLGDLSNNWVGRLARLYGEQSTTAAQAWKLTEWLVNSIPWLYIVGGNHDCWSGSGDPIKWMVGHAGTLYEAWGVRIGMEFLNGKVIRVNARHDFVGHSMWNPAHGPMKAVQAGWRDHVLTCGHKHTSFIAGPLKDPATHLLSWAIRCAGYKVIDGYATEKGLPDQNAFSSAATIIDPTKEDDDASLITVFASVEEAADFLTYKRKREGVWRPRNIRP